MLKKEKVGPGPKQIGTDREGKGEYCELTHEVRNAKVQFSSIRKSYEIRDGGRIIRIRFIDCSDRSPMV
jgi:hypothetical protein